MKHLLLLVKGHVVGNEGHLVQHLQARVAGMGELQHPVPLGHHGGADVRNGCAGRHMGKAGRRENEKWNELRFTSLKLNNDNKFYQNDKTAMDWNQNWGPPPCGFLGWGRCTCKIWVSWRTHGQSCEEKRKGMHNGCCHICINAFRTVNAYCDKFKSLWAYQWELLSLFQSGLAYLNQKFELLNNILIFYIILTL